MPTTPTTSRYAGVGGVPDNVDSNVTSKGTSVGATNSSGTQTGTSATNSSTSGTSTTNNMSAVDQHALDNLISQLLSGGTPEMKASAAARRAATDTVNSQIAGYSKGAAFNDAQGLVSQQMRRTLEQLLPSINRAAEDAGSSGGALRALLLQDAANKAAESSSALGVQTAVQYGGVSANMDQVLERLTQTDPTAVNALINALGVSKGATTTTNSTTNNTTVGATTQNTNTASNTATTENKNVNTDYVPFSNQNFGNVVAYSGGSGPVDNSKYIGTTTDTLAALQGNNAWSGYKF